MIRRTVGFHIAPDGSVSPAMPQYGGVKGEHHATTLSMTLSATAPYRDGDLVRLRFAGGDGSVLSSDLIEDYIVQDGRMVLSYSLPAVLTRVGGQLGVRLVLSRVDDNGTETETFLSHEATLWFDDAPTENGTPFWTGVSEMLRRTAAASDAAAEARDAARDRAEAAATDADRAERFSEAAGDDALRAIAAKTDAQLFASAAVSARDVAQAEAASAESAATAAKNAAATAMHKAEELEASSRKIDKNAEDILQLASFTTLTKLDNSGYEPNKYLGTDEAGNVVAKDGSMSAEQVMETVDSHLTKTVRTVPAYVLAEADRVAREVLAHQNENTFSFAAIADSHVNVGTSPYDKQSQAGIRHAGMAIERIASQIGLDFVVNLGDNLWGTNEDVDLAIEEQLVLNREIFDGFRTVPQFRLIGNHDANLWNYCISTTAIYGMNGRYNDFDVVGETKTRGYGYKDMAEHKLRVIGLNTSDYIDNKGGYMLSDEQKRWFMSALDLSDKSDAAEWQILLLSHIPLDYPEGDASTPTDIPAILTAYQSGSSVTITAGSYDYSGKNKAQIIGNIHGHIHNFSRGMMTSGILRVCTPNTSFYSNGTSGTGVDELYQPNEVYNKTADSAADTTVTIYTVDTASKTIYSTNYGAGYDRVVTYDGTEPEQEVFSHTVTDLTASLRQMVEVTDGVLAPYNDNTRIALAVTTPNDCSWSARADTGGATLYMIPIPAKAAKVKVTATDNVFGSIGFCGINMVDGVCTKTFDSGWITDFSYTFGKGAASYLLVTLITADNTNVSWEYDAGADMTVTFE